jgi:hypothetical protein
MTFDDIVSQLFAFRHRSLGNGVTDEEIDAASATLEVPIRGGYRMFLRKFGYGGVADFDLYGLGQGIPEDLNLVVMTQSERTEAYPNIPPHLLPIMNSGGGDHACLDTKASPDEPPVVWWWHEDGPDQIPQPEAPDFLSWLSKRLHDRAGDK